MFVTEDPERETLKLAKSPSGAAARWSVEGKLLKNKASGRCIGRWQNAPPPAPGPHPGPHGHGPSTATEENIDYLVKWMLGLKKYKNLTIDSIGVGYNEVRRTGMPESGLRVPMISAMLLWTGWLLRPVDEGGQARVCQSRAERRAHHRHRRLLRACPLAGNSLRLFGCILPKTPSGAVAGRAASTEWCRRWPQTPSSTRPSIS